MRDRIRRISLATLAITATFAAAAAVARYRSTAAARPSRIARPVHGKSLPNLLQAPSNVQYAYSWKRYSANDDGKPKYPEAVVQFKARASLSVVRVPEGVFAELHWSQCEAHAGDKPVEQIMDKRPHRVPLTEAGFPTSFDAPDEAGLTVGMHRYNLIGIMADPGRSPLADAWRADASIPLRVVSPRTAAGALADSILAYQVVDSPSPDRTTIARLWNVRAPPTEHTGYLWRHEFDEAVFTVDLARGIVVRVAGRLTRIALSAHASDWGAICSRWIEEYQAHEVVPQ